MNRRLVHLAGLTAALFWAAGTPLQAQTAITSAVLSSTDGADEIVNGRTYLNQTLSLDRFDAGGNTFALSGSADTIHIRRTVGGLNRAHIWYDTTSDAGDRYSSYINNLEDAIFANNLHVGTHNLFANTANSVANIERVDLMVTGGFAAPEGFVIPVFDFGTNPAHESFSIALITGVDGAGDPNAFSTLAGTAPFNAPNIHTHDSFSIERFAAGNDTSGTPYSIFNTTSDQGPGGVIFTLDDFNVSAGSTIYGYSLFGYDVTTGGDTDNLIDWTNSTYYPTNTPESNNTAGGFDFAGVNGIFFQDVAFAVVPEPSVYGIGGILVVVLSLFRRRRRASFAA